MSFAVFDRDSVMDALKRVWDEIAPPAMFTATGNITLANTENFLNALDMLKWNITTQEGIIGAHPSNGNGGGYVPEGHPGGGSPNSQGSHPNYGFSGTTPIDPNTTHGSDSKPILGEDDFNRYNVVDWGKSDNQIRVPVGFTPLRGENIGYADQLPPFDITLTFANEYGQSAFQKIYDAEILNESSGVSVDTIVLAKEYTYIARRISPVVRGVYSREQGGKITGLPVIAN